ncbi:glycosyl hydrolase family 95 catalytic domain-containing protein [Gryllotalpicola koreensis]|uniref:Glycoside hydrolase family 95 protein n=1 Tax=Gryllotalpicola koreensis TaxID=993086 RepID=A0ABP8ACL5_9MICO
MTAMQHEYDEATDVIALDAPADGFIDSFLLGNGWLGAALRGGPGTERIDLNADTLWSGGPESSSGDPVDPGLVEALRAAVSHGDDARAERLAARLQGVRFAQSYQPVGWLEWSYAGASVGDYRRALNLATATSTTAFSTADGDVEVTAFCSHPAGVFVGEARGAVGALELSFRSEHPNIDVRRESLDGCEWLIATGRVPARVDPNYVASPVEHVVYAQDRPDTDGTVAAGMGFAVAAMLERTAADSVRVIATVATGYRGWDARPSADAAALSAEARNRVAAAAGSTTRELAAEHREDHRLWYEKARLRLGGDDTNTDSDESLRRQVRYFNLGRYLLISSSRPGTQAANLQGIWNVDVRPGWCCGYTTNINLQMNYWAAPRTGLDDLMAPLAELATDLAVRGEAAARRYGARGSAVHHNSDLWRFVDSIPGLPQWSNWPSALLWLADQLRQSSATSPHAARALRSVLPRAVDFVLDMLVEHDDGALVVSPSTSPEHFFLIDAADGAAEHGATAAVSAGATMDQELARAALSAYVRDAGGDQDGRDGRERRDRARHALARLRAPRSGRDGALLEWANERTPGEVGHRHLSHLYGLYPGDRITESGTPGDFAAAREALRRRLSAGSGYTGWSQAWILCLAARLGDGDLATRSLHILTTELCSRSMLDLHPHDDWPEGAVFQIDGNLGAVAGMVELLVQGSGQELTLLNALPSQWRSGRATGLRDAAGRWVELSWSHGRLERLTVEASATGPIRLDVPQSGLCTITDSAGRDIRSDTTPHALRPERQWITWSATASTRYIATWSRTHDRIEEP